MEIYFSSKKLQKMFSDPKRYYGAERGEAIEQRMMEFDSANSLATISKLTGVGLHPLRENRRDQLAVNAVHPYRIVFEVLDCPDKSDYSKMKKILILDVINYHRGRG